MNKNCSQKMIKKARIAVAKLTINQVLQQAVDAHKAGQLQEAHRLYALFLKYSLNILMRTITLGYWLLDLVRLN